MEVIIVSKTKITIEMTSTVEQTPGQIVSDMNGEKVMLSVANSKYYNLGVIGGDIWGIIKEPITIEKLVNKLLDKYDITQEECQKQVQSFLLTLKKEGLIKIINKEKRRVNDWGKN
jgi:hypothetical protein